MKNKKSLGQNWLKDREILGLIADTADLGSDDTVLEIGPGLGTLTSVLLRRAGKVVAVEFDDELAKKLPAQFPGTNLEVHSADILKFDLRILPANYKVVANVPYYITSPILRTLLQSVNPPSHISILIQKEVAERLAAKPGDMSMLALSAQIYCQVSLGLVVDREFFIPVPKVDSQVVLLDRRENPLIDEEDLQVFFRIAKAGFASKRKKLRSSLSAGLHIEKNAIEQILESCHISGDSRAEDLSIEEWSHIVRAVVDSKSVIL